MTESFEFLVDVDPEIWVRAKQEAEYREMSLKDFVEIALWEKIHAYKRIRRLGQRG